MRKNTLSRGQVRLVSPRYEYASPYVIGGNVRGRLRDNEGVGPFKTSSWSPLGLLHRTPPQPHHSLPPQHQGIPESSARRPVRYSRGRKNQMYDEAARTCVPAVHILTWPPQGEQPDLLVLF
ncbi:hypothetical protein O3P69_007627 [Scylla paramamosain]|uniref:Uncharacterized protein n=1 Tax=Scylla paramamosain TaxID=85552 RepID=A0AAW0UXS8_SCYPA